MLNAYVVISLHLWFYFLGSKMVYRSRIQCKEHGILNFMRLMAYWVLWIHAWFVAMFVFRFILRWSCFYSVKALLSLVNWTCVLLVCCIYTVDYKTLDSIILVLGLFSSIADVSYTLARKKHSHYNISLCIRNKIDL